MASRGKSKRKFGESSLGEPGSFGESMARPKEMYDNPSENPLEGLEPSGNLEDDSAAEMKAIHDAMIETRRKVDRKVKHAIDGAYYMTIVWLSVDDRDAFLKEVRMDRSVYRGSFLDGYQLTRQLGLDIEYPYKDS